MILGSRMSIWMVYLRRPDQQEIKFYVNISGKRINAGGLNKNTAEAASCRIIKVPLQIQKKHDVSGRCTFKTELKLEFGVHILCICTTPVFFKGFCYFDKKKLPEIFSKFCLKKLIKKNPALRAGFDLLKKTLELLKKTYFWMNFPVVFKGFPKFSALRADC